MLLYQHGLTRHHAAASSKLGMLASVTSSPGATLMDEDAPVGHCARVDSASCLCSSIMQQVCGLQHNSAALLLICLLLLQLCLLLLLCAGCVPVLLHPLLHVGHDISSRLQLLQGQGCTAEGVCG